ncbi:hypothetical protein [Acetobacter cibinongensis]|nr:hypothetical protein [Acetobacter cibinongensis]
MSLPKKKKKAETDVPVIDMQVLIYLHIGLAVFMTLWAWLDWSLPQ